jgi:hypothetical protein
MTRRHIERVVVRQVSRRRCPIGCAWGAFKLLCTLVLFIILLHALFGHM